MVGVLTIKLKGTELLEVITVLNSHEYYCSVAAAVKNEQECLMKLVIIKLTGTE